MDLHEIWCSECSGFVGYSTSTQPLPPITHGPCGERAKRKNEDDAERDYREREMEQLGHDGQL